MSPQGDQTGAAAHERKDADVIGVALVGAFLLLSLVITSLCVWGLLRFFNSQRSADEARPPQATEQGAEFPRPRLQVHPAADLKQSRAAEETKLHSYGWIDRSAGVAHIPIERGMQLTLERGLPEVGGGQTRLQLMQARPETNPRPNEPVTSSPAPEATP
jgi:hypothetical protein